MITPRTAAEIRRLFTIEGWRRHTIAGYLGIHHGTVRRALDRAGLLPPGEPRRRRSMLDPYVEFIRKTFERYPKLPAVELYEMVRQRGYPGGPDYFRHRIAELGLRPRQAPEAFLVLRTLPGEQAQVDWAYFGERSVEGGRRRLWAFVMVLSYCRLFFLRFFYDARLPSFLTGHVEAFSFFGGVARTALYDNLKSAVLERRGSAIRFHPRLLELTDHYGFDPRPVAPRRGNEKGRVERAIRYLRTSFFPLRQTWSLEALNRDASTWCRDRSSQRRWPQDRRRSVEQAYLEERAHLLPLPAEPFPCHERVIAQLRRSPYARFDANRYSVPHDRIQRPVTLLADLERIRIFDRQELVAEHARCWGKNQIIEDPAHLDALWRSKHKARVHRGQDRLLRAVPQAEELLSELARRQRHLATAVARLLRLLEAFGVEELQVAVAEALEKGSPHPETVRMVLDRRRQARQAKPPIAIELPDDPRVKNLVVTPHALADYDPEEEE
jgi:transposase